MPRYIDADAVVERLDEIQPFAGNKAANAAINLCKDIVRNAPTVSADDVRGVGEWIRLDAHKGMEQYKCSACNTPMYVPECMGEPMYSFCPICGAKMEVSEDA